MRKIIKWTPLTLVGIFVLSFVLMALPATASDDIQRVYDYAGLLSDEDIQQLEKESEKYSAKRDINYLIVTVDSTEDFAAANLSATSEELTEAYSEDFYLKFIETYGDEEADCTILAIDMSNRYADISSQGIAKVKFDDNKRTPAVEKVLSYLSDGEYYTACSQYIKIAHRYIGIKAGVDPEFPLLKLWFQVLIALIVGGISIGIMLANTGGRVTVDQGTYLDQKASRVLAKRDQYLRTILTKVHKPKDTGSNGGGGNSSGGGGGNHSGGHF